jgi:alpha-beta hydrolase superfamily lysophospholipase
MRPLAQLKKHKIKASILTSFLIGILFVHFYLPRIFIEPNNIIVKLLNKSPNQLTPKAFSLDYNEMEVFTADGFKLSGYKIYSENSKNKGTIIFLHGLRAYKEHFLPLCKLLSERGFNSVIIDLRGHGASGGTYCTFGHKEKQDMVSVLDAIMLDDRLSKNIGVWGQSLGGAIALQTMAIDKRIKYGVIESTFSDLKDVSEEYLKRLLKIDNMVVSNYLLQRVYAIAEIYKVKPKEIVKEITQPIILVHGLKDKRINIYHALLNYKNLKSKDKTLLQIEEATHLNVWKKGGSKYRNTVFSFFERNSNND